MAGPIPPTPRTQLDAMAARAKEASRRFARLSIDERIGLIQAMRRGHQSVAADAVRAACEAKGITLGTSLEGEEWLGGPMVTERSLRLLLQSLEQIRANGLPTIEPDWIAQLPDGRLSVRIFPMNRLEAMLLAKTTAEAHLLPGVTRENLREHQAQFYRKPHDGRVCVVLGAGNVNSIPAADCLYKLFVEGTVCILKMNPVNEYLGPLLERAFAPAVDLGYFQVAYGGADEGSALINHPAVDEVHITGSDKTHDVMVWGPPGPERDARKARHDPLLKKTITSELGNITPVLVVPGPYSDGDLRFQGGSIAGMVANNASFNCNSAKLLVTPTDWKERGKLVDEIEAGLKRAEPRKAYYPGAEERWHRFTDGRAHVRRIGQASQGVLPWAIIEGVDPKDLNDPVFVHEPWCSVLSETQLPGGDLASYLDRAVAFLNEHVWGTLCITLVVHPQTFADPKSSEVVERAIRQLKYGTVAINAWPAAVFGLSSPPWGGHPSATLEDIQSGKGLVHNTLMLDAVEKCVLRAPLRSFPPPPWFAGHRKLNVLGRRLFEFESNPGWTKVAGLAAAALGA